MEVTGADNHEQLEIPMALVLLLMHVMERCIHGSRIHEYLGWN